MQYHSWNIFEAWAGEYRISAHANRPTPAPEDLQGQPQRLIRLDLMRFWPTCSYQIRRSFTKTYAQREEPSFHAPTTSVPTFVLGFCLIYRFQITAVALNPSHRSHLLVGSKVYLKGASVWYWDSHVELLWTGIEALGRGPQIPSVHRELPQKSVLQCGRRLSGP